MGRPTKNNHLVTFSLPVETIKLMEAELRRRHGEAIPHGARSDLVRELVEKSYGRKSTKV